MNNDNLQIHSYPKVQLAKASKEQTELVVLNNTWD